jgi:hypothetical protein
VDALDLRLPCRTFAIRYKTAEAGQHALSSEFLLRLLRVAGELGEEDVAAYFDFDANETAFAIDQAEQRGLVQRAAGRVQLTAAGSAAFVAGSGTPQLYEVHQKQGRFDFDLVSFSPARPRHVEGFGRDLGELPIIDVAALSRASEAARESFRRNFREILIERREQESERKGLYTIDDVRAERRRDEIVSVGISVSPAVPNRAVPSLTAWRSGYELETRSSVLTSVGRFVGSADIERSATSEAAYQVLARIAPELTKPYTRTPAFDRQAFFRWAVERSGDMQANRRTVPMVGTIWTKANAVALGTAARLLRRERATGSQLAFWLRPPLPNWGSNLGVPEIAASLMSEMEADGPDGEYDPKYACVGLGAHSPTQFRSKHAFSDFVVLPAAACPPDGVEILVFPNRLAVTLVHGALAAGLGYPVALGMASVDEAVVGRAQAYVSSLVGRCNPSQVGSGVFSADAFLAELAVRAPSSGEHRS